MWQNHIFGRNWGHKITCIVKHEGLLKATQGRMMYFGCKDGRFNLLYPFFGNVLVGSTDLDQPDPDLAHCSAEEADYLFKISNKSNSRIS